MAQHRGSDKRVILKMFIKKSIMEKQDVDCVFNEQKVTEAIHSLLQSVTVHRLLVLIIINNLLNIFFNYYFKFFLMLLLF